ncbi:EpsG family protein [Shewanella baltica]|uniref:EpsG family protein n=1 Tax=Shewanella baltica (strain OS155 / ATCC BAA-1091) TaxID=325240 RepID=A3D6K3_SHEB5|nr:EpsG family protein [Shewanella baltica]ABN62366.1 hypothetical protein Sbal_2883 [Shewanella baltica OS155]AEH14710.1 hypothetical protein Sbal117_3021 [Shewanella baltica OS117]
MILVVRYRTLFIILTGLLLAIVAAFRGGNDPDYGNYYDIYISSLHNSFLSLNIEPFYFFINKTLASVDAPFILLMLLIAVPAVLLKIYVIYKHSHLAFFSILIYILTIYISFDLIAIRQGLAISFIMLATSHWSNNRNFSIALVLIGSLFHLSALVVLPIFYLFSSKWQKNIFHLSFYAILFISFFGIKITVLDFIKIIPFIPSFILYKLDIYASYNQEGLNSAKQFFVCIIAFLIYNSNVKNNFIKQVSFLYVLGFLLSILFSSIGDIAFRIKWYFFWGEIFFIPYILSILVYKSKHRNSIPLLFVLFLLFLLLMYLYPAVNFINDIHSRGNSIIY